MCTPAAKRRNHVIPIRQKEQRGKRSDGAYSETPGYTDCSSIRRIDTYSQWLETKRERGWDTVSNTGCCRQHLRQLDREWKHAKSGAWSRSTRTTGPRLISTSSSIHHCLGQPIGMTLGRRLWDFVDTVIIMLTLCVRSVVHGQSQMVLLQASIQQRFTPGLNDSSPSHPHLQIHSPDMVRRLTLPRPKKEIYI